MSLEELRWDWYENERDSALYPMHCMRVSIGGKDGFVQMVLDWDWAFVACVHIGL
jgi:hypothetical protein